LCLPPDAAELTAICAPGDEAGAAAVPPRACPVAAPASAESPASPSTVDAGTPPAVAGPPNGPDAGTTRSRNAVQADIREAEAGLRRLGPNDPGLPAARLALAKLYEEMVDLLREEAAEHDLRALEAEDAGDPRAAGASIARRDASRASAEAWGDKATAALLELVADSAGSPEYGEALFRLAFLFEERAREAEDPEQAAELFLKARTVYNTLIRDVPDSEYVPNAYLAFAEYHFNDGDMARALEYYRRVVQFAGSPVIGFALYKQAWCLFNLQDFPEALATFQKVVDWAATHPDRPDAAQLARAARQDLPAAYAEIGRPEAAWAYFERVGGGDAARLMEALANHYESRGQPDDAITVMHALMDRTRDEDALCDRQGRVARIRLAAGTVDGRTRGALVDEFRRLIDVWRYFVGEGGAARPAEARTRCSRETALLVLDTATGLHREAMGTPASPGTREPGTLEAAGDLYGLFLDAFGDPASPFFADCLLAGSEARPVSSIRFFRAEAYWAAEDWAKCGPAYDDVSRSDPAGPYAGDALYSAVLCHRRIVDDGGRWEPRFVLPRRTGSGAADGRVPAPRDFTAAERALEAAIRRYLCRFGGGDRSANDAERAASREDFANVEVMRAMLYLGADRLQEAAVLFRSVADAHAASEDVDDRSIAVLSAISALEILVRLERAGLTACGAEASAEAAAATARGFPSAADAAVLSSREERDALAAYLAAVAERGGR
jgi:tetratricopeptide (TPR) repeat protein